MNILLLNDNPVVAKLVTLSAQKTSNELDMVTSVEEIENNNYDLIVIDDALYTQDIVEEIKSKTDFKKSLYIYSYDSQEVEGFTDTLKKPFLPTDLVELFVSFSKDANEVDTSNEELDIKNSLDELEQEDNDFLELDIEDDSTNYDINLDNLSSDELEDYGESSNINFDSEFINEGVLDKDEIQEVQELLKETENAEIDDFEESDVKEIDDLITSDGEDWQEDLYINNINNEDLESEIEDAILSLDEEELEEEVDFDTLIDIATNDIDALKTLNTRDIKLAIGEEIASQELKIDAENEIWQDEPIDEEDNISQEAQTQESNEGVETLKKLLKALSNEGVVASMKDMKININITIGDK